MIDKITPESPRPDVVASAGLETEQTINDSPGRLIRQARERVDMSLDELSAQTKLPHGVLDALERDDFKTLREPVYVRGYYRKCCKSLKLSEETLITAYQRKVGSSAPSSPSKFLLVPDNEVFGSSGSGSMRWWVVLVVVVAILVAIYWYLHNRTTSTAVSPIPVVPSSAIQKPNTPSPTSGEANTGGNAAIAVTATPTSASSSVSDATPVEGRPGAVGSMTESLPATRHQNAAAVPSSTSNATQSLTLNFNQTSWVRIEDSTGKMLLTGVIQAGGKKVLAGKPPYAVFLGNAPGVTVEYDDKTVGIQSFIQSNSTARFSVPQG